MNESYKYNIKNHLVKCINENKSFCIITSNGTIDYTNKDDRFIMLKILKQIEWPYYQSVDISNCDKINEYLQHNEKWHIKLKNLFNIKNDIDIHTKTIKNNNDKIVNISNEIFNLVSFKYSLCNTIGLIKVTPDHIDEYTVTKIINELEFKIINIFKERCFVSKMIQNSTYELTLREQIVQYIERVINSGYIRFALESIKHLIIMTKINSKYNTDISSLCSCLLKQMINDITHDDVKIVDDVKNNKIDKLKNENILLELDISNNKLKIDEINGELLTIKNK